MKSILNHTITSKKVIIALQIIVPILAFILAVTKNMDIANTNHQPTDYVQPVMSFLNLPKPDFIWKVCIHNYVLAVSQAVLSFFSFGLLGIWFLFSNFYIYGIACKYTNNLFILLEMMGTLLSIYSSTSFAFHVLRDKRKLSTCFYKIIIYLIITFFIFLFGAYFEGGMIFG